MDKPFLARYICLVTHEQYQQGVVYTVEEHGMIDFGLDYRDWKINGESIDVSKFDRVHHNIEQYRP